MDKWSKLYKCLIFDPPILITQASLEELNTILYPFKVLRFKILDQVGQIFDANFSHAPNIVLVEHGEGIVEDLFDE